MSTMLSLRDLDREDVLKALVKEVAGRKVAAECVRRYQAGERRFDYHDTQPICLDLSDENEFRVDLFEQQFGLGVAHRVMAKLRDGLKDRERPKKAKEPEPVTDG